MKILFLMSHAGQARNFESTLRGLAERGHEVHMAYDRMQKRNLAGLQDLANTLVEQYPGLTSGQHPRPPKGDPALVGARLRSSLDFMRYLEPEFEDAPKLRRRAERFAPQRTREMIESSSPFTQSLVRASFRSAEHSMKTSPVVDDYLEEHSPDAVLVTPLLEPGSFQLDYLRGAKRRGIPTCLCVASWDNLTNKGLIHEVPNEITVWNEFQRDEAAALHGVPPERVVVTGAVAYDHWFGWTPSRSREEFAAAVGLDSARPFVLYVGSSGFIAPDEASFVVEWMRGLEGAGGLGDAQVLARPHPANPLVGAAPSQSELATMEKVKLYPPAGANPTDTDSRRDYFDSLYYCSAVAGVNTSAFLEAAIVGRPVFTVLSERNEETQAGMLHFHHLLTAGGGLLHTAEDYREHAAKLREALAAPHPDGCISEKSVEFTKAFIRPYGLDQAATPRMLDAIEELDTEEARAAAKGRRRTLTGIVLGGVARLAFGREVRRQRRQKHRRDRELKARVAAGEPAKGAKAKKAKRAAASVPGQNAPKAPKPKAKKAAAGKKPKKQKARRELEAERR